MLFPTYLFIFGFLPITLLAFHNRERLRIPISSTVLLLVASLIFYLLPNWQYGVIFVTSILFNYFISKLIQGKQSTSFTYLTVGVTFNLLLIGYYKYLYFFTDLASYTLGFDNPFSPLVLPVGISFYTFQQISYLVDCYRERNVRYSFHDYALFVSFFPQLIAGPIVHHKEMLPQIHSLSTKTFDKNLFHMGMSLLIIGLGKKLIIADNLAPIVNQTFIVVENGEMVSAMTAWLGMLAYTLQVYFDFSAYSDMAIGLGLMFGLKLPINFNSPYKSTSIIEFWRRWHMTLSRFLRDYLYIPLGGSRHGNFRRFSALIITMLLCGLWHGAGINFIIWGGLNGVFLVINVIYRKSKYGSKNLIPVWVGLVVTLLCVMLARVFFRTESFSSATIYLSSLWNRDPTSFVLPLSLFSLLFIFTSLAVALFAPNSCEICNYQQSKSVDNPSSGTRYLKHVRGFSIALGIILAFSLMRIPQPSVFIYFNF